MFCTIFQVKTGPEALVGNIVTAFGTQSISSPVTAGERTHQAGL
jgi:hypothetical protein